jgi:aspartate kinase
MIVMKFGGTSVGSAESIAHVASIVASRAAHKPVVVVSAVAGITDELLQIAKTKSKKERERLVQEVTQKHKSILAHNSLSENVCRKVLTELSTFVSSLAATPTKKSIDTLVSFGERLSARIVAAQLVSQECAAVAYDAYDVGMITTSVHGDAAPLPSTPALLSKKILKLGHIPVITGFIGKSKGGAITTLGRGGSDYTTAIIGGALNAERIEIWKEVDGVLSTDPRVVPSAKLIPCLHYEEAAELAYFGAKVLHPKTMMPAIEKSVPIVVLNTFKPTGAGTTIQSDRKRASHTHPKALSVKRGVTILTLNSSEFFDGNKILSRLFALCSEHSVLVDVIATSVTSISLVVQGTHITKHFLKKIASFGAVEVSQPYAIVCIVGLGMNVAETIARASAVLSEKKMAVRLISESATGTSITLLVDDAVGKDAVVALHAIL